MIIMPDINCLRKHMKLTKVQQEIVSYMQGRDSVIIVQWSGWLRRVIPHIISRGYRNVYPYYSGEHRRFVEQRTLDHLLRKGVIKCSHIRTGSFWDSTKGRYKDIGVEIDDNVKLQIALGIIDMEDCALIYTLVEDEK